MKKELLKPLIGAALLLGSSTAFCASTEVWCAVTDKGVSVPLSEVSYMVLSDGGATFSVEKTDGTSIDGVRCVKFEKQGVSTGARQTSSSPASVYPNPVKGSLTLTGVDKGVRIGIYNHQGWKVRSLESNGGATTIDVSGLSAGAYVLRANGKSMNFIKR